MDMTNAKQARFSGNRRIHISFGVSKIEESKRFYRTVLDCEPTVEKAGYAKFEPHDPSVSLSLIAMGDNRKADRLPGHFGVQVKSTAAVEDAAQRLANAGIDVRREKNVTCCYAVQDKIWAVDPDGNHWEVFFTHHVDAGPRQEDDSPCCPQSVCCAATQ